MSILINKYKKSIKILTFSLLFASVSIAQKDGGGVSCYTYENPTDFCCVWCIDGTMYYMPCDADIFN